MAVSGISSLLQQFEKERAKTEALCLPLSAEDTCIQSMNDVSPPKWHLGHTTWFFDQFVLAPHQKAYRPYHPKYKYLFNSYYQTVGVFLEKTGRGVLSRPSLEEVICYRKSVTEGVIGLLSGVGSQLAKDLCFLVGLGIQHEQQHQELLLMDVKHNFASNPLKPTYRSVSSERGNESVSALMYLPIERAVAEIGFDGTESCFDNERPRHSVVLEPFQLASRLITNGEYLNFINDNGYSRHDLWLSDGWIEVKRSNWKAPLYWEKIDDLWHVMTLHGLEKLRAEEPVCHVSYYEADAYARWSNKRLPTESEWESVANKISIEGNFLELDFMHPRGASNNGNSFSQIYGDVWEWTQSAYLPYPGYRPLEGALGEYNGKFMCNQMVLRGGSCVTPQTHMRSTYRNFYYPKDRWQFSGIRLAENL